ncbi:MAG: hypothetical protein K0Q95_1816 [Bacteroidota bacterium]|nr:hypothetical protein [Bacteroidota bacterium]
MKKIIYLFATLLFFCVSCKKEEKKHTVVYKISVLSGNPSYSVQYSGSNNTTRSEGPMNSKSWTSSTVEGRKAGTSVALTLQGGSGGSYQMYIIIDGSVQKEDRMDDPYGPKTITANIPN